MSKRQSGEEKDHHTMTHYYYVSFFFYLASLGIEHLPVLNQSTL